MVIIVFVWIVRLLKTEHYSLPNVEDLFINMSNSAIFCVIYLSGAYKQLEVSASSKEYLTINTLRGLYGYTRLTME